MDQRGFLASIAPIAWAMEPSRGFLQGPLNLVLELDIVRQSFCIVQGQIRTI